MSHLYVAQGGYDNLGPSGNVVASLTVPAGTYLVTATVQVLNLDGSSQWSACELSDGVSFTLASFPVLLPQTQSTFDPGASITMQGLYTPSASATLTLSCSGFNVDARQAVVSAIAFDAVN